MYFCIWANNIIVSLTDGLMDGLTDILIDWLIDGLVDWLIDWLNDWLIDWLLDGWMYWLLHWLVDWLIDWLIDWLLHWLVDGKMLACLLDWLINWQHGSLKRHVFLYLTRPLSQNGVLLVPLPSYNLSRREIYSIQYFILTSVHTKVILDKQTNKQTNKQNVNTELDLDKNIHPHSPIHLLRTNIIEVIITCLQDYELSILQ